MLNRQDSNIISSLFSDNFAVDGNYSSEAISTNKNSLQQKYLVSIFQMKKIFFPNR